MGLDMYLEKHIYIGGKYLDGKVKIKGRKKEGSAKVTIDRGDPCIGPKFVEIDFNEVSSVAVSVAYWRKANAIHNWFIQNCAKGVDDCRPVYVEPSQLIELRKICEDILKRPEGEERDSAAESMLPTCDGFFFGTTEYGEWYYQQLQNTVDMLKDIAEGDHDDYYYEASC